ncbi:glycoside hydrolase family 6 protein [Streptomyces sp. 4N509B]|uniref:glycoside hydrolase family 6 protein n=1 Tax=Streptomyces sp. 4N509B TaxID=3457413 RepID=UPI003FCF255B
MARTRLLLATSAALGGLFVWSAVAAAQAGPADEAGTRELPDDTVFYNHPGSVHDWVAANPSDPRTSLIEDRIANTPTATWLSSYDPATVTADVSAVTSAAEAAGQVPVLVSYQIPDRDCGGASAGGAPDLPSYLSWTEGFAAGLGSSPVVVILEPDAIALSECLDDAGRAERFGALAEAADIIHAANPEARVYFDAGHSGWHAPGAIAGLLREAGVLESGDGIYSNVSNYNTTQNEVAFVDAVLAELGDPELRGVIDTSRNGNGPAPGGEWCDPPDRLVGESPSVNTASASVDAYLWIKRPGELDGCDGPAGSFSPDKAYELAGG